MQSQFLPNMPEEMLNLQFLTTKISENNMNSPFQYFFQDLVEYISKNAHLLQKYQSEDVSVGTWLAPLKIHRVHDTRFDTEFRSRGCHNKYLVSHKQSVEDFRSKHYSLQSKGELCEKEEQLRISYEYNWNTVPSQCCIRNNTALPWKTDIFFIALGEVRSFNLNVQIDLILICHETQNQGQIILLGIELYQLLACVFCHTCFSSV